MPIYAVSDPEDAFAVIRLLKLPPSSPRSVLRGAEAAGVDAPIPGTLALGSQVAEFSPGIGNEQRSDIVNSFLVAQLAANSLLASVGGNSADWYERYFFVLANSGWRVDRPPPVTHTLAMAPDEVYRELIPIVSAALGDLAAHSTIMSALRGLATMAHDRPWITLFQRESSRATANQFQIAYVDAKAGTEPDAVMTDFDLTASERVTQVLFFRSSSANATLRHSTARLAINRPVFDRVKPLVEERIREQLGAYLAAVEL